MVEIDRMVWVDLETTGLDPYRDLILEVGIVVTDRNLDVIDDFHALVWETPFYEEWLKKVENTDDWCWTTHNASGLIGECLAGGMTMFELGNGMAHFLGGMGIVAETKEPMVGSSVQFDRGFLHEQFPQIEEHFSYRNIDISSIKELCMRYNPELYAKLDVVTQPKKLHRVLPDIHDTIDEFRFYRDNFLFTGEY